MATGQTLLPPRKPYPIRLREREREILERAAAIKQEYPSAWARQVIVREGERVIAEANALTAAAKRVLRAEENRGASPAV